MRSKRAKKSEVGEANSQLEKTKKWLKEQTSRAIAVRSKDREFHGLEREFIYQQATLISKFDQSKDVHHPRDVGDVRETILRRFLIDSGYLPAKYAVSERSTRIASTSGHVSDEIDIAIFDRENSVSLMRREDSFEVLPVESVYGVIQVKSKLRKNEIRSGLQNLASYKSLNKRDQRVHFGHGRIEPRGFAILFAYDAELEWLDIINEITQFANANPNRTWANAVFILKKGHFLHGTERFGSAYNTDIEKIKDLRIHGVPDLNGIVLYAFQSVLLELLSATPTSSPPFGNYFSLPLVAGEHSYRFVHSLLGEMGSCAKHGDFSRKAPAEKLEMIKTACQGKPAMSSSEILSKVLQSGGNPTNDRVWIYNPEEKPLPEILINQQPDKDGKILPYITYDMIEIDGAMYWVPYYYSFKHGLISLCPKCFPMKRRKLPKNVLDEG